jgi:AmmeMemoRadiSam system protein B
MAPCAGPRPPAAAGIFYPRSAAALSKTVADLLAHAQVQERLCPCGVIAPHAGYPYSGSVAAQAFANVRRIARPIARAIVVGPAHFVAFPGIAAPSSGVFLTPLGTMPVDVAAVEALTQEGLVTINDAAHAPEHAIEVELPFLQSMFGPLPIIPLLCGSITAQAIAAVIARVWSDDTLLVVSSDMSHYEDYPAARDHDARTSVAIERLDESAIGPADACGHLAIRGALIEAMRRRLSVNRLALCNSGDTAGDRRSVVGYGAWAFQGPG